jgi:hypothetical protein
MTSFLCYLKHSRTTALLGRLALVLMMSTFLALVIGENPARAATGTTSTVTSTADIGSFELQPQSPPSPGHHHKHHRGQHKMQPQSPPSPAVNPIPPESDIGSFEL